jgi:uncharacterized protein
MIQIQDIYIYPVKSLGGFRVEQSRVTDRGLQYDRRWMLVDAQDRFLTQREYPAMALLKTSLKDDVITVMNTRYPDRRIQFPAAPAGAGQLRVRIWDDMVPALPWLPETNQWFSEQIGFDCRLVYMPEESQRQVDRTYAPEGNITAFSDGYPILLISQASLDDLNRRLPQPVPMNRFRPNLVISGAGAFDEDRMDSFEINGLDFRGVKPCARCVMTTIDQETGISGKDPLRTLAGYRQRGNKVLFGQNVLCSGQGSLQIRDIVSVTVWREVLLRS